MMTRIVKLVISAFFFSYIEIKRLCVILFNMNSKPLCVTLYYHSIYPNEKSRFRKQMELVRKKTDTIPADYFGELDSLKRYSILTFDDGFQNLIENAIPTLVEFNLPFTIFFITNYFGKTPGWKFPYGHRDQKQIMMNEDEFNNLPHELLTVGSHTENHVKLSKLTLDELTSELKNSKNFLDKISKKEVNLISFPNGEYNSEVIEKSFEVGYKRAFTIEPDFSLKTPNEKVTARIWANGNDWTIEFWLKLHGGYCWLNNAFILKNKMKRLLKV